MNILALDPATNCGFAHSSGASGVWDLSVRRDESGGMRLIRLKSKLNETLAAGVDLVVYEAQRGGLPGRLGALVVQAGIQGVLLLWCEENKIEYRGYSPKEIKKHATGKGGASKAVVLEAARARWYDRLIGDDNEADALWLLDLAMRDYGKNSKTPVD